MECVCVVVMTFEQINILLMDFFFLKLVELSKWVKIRVR